MDVFSKPGEALTILVVEDDPEVQALLRDEFTDEGYRVLQAENGEEAQDMIEKEFFDVVILDLMFPKGNGLRLLPLIKGRGDGIPVIVFSAFGDRETRTEAFRMGADQFVAKPFRMGTLKNALQEVALKKKEA